MTATNAAPTARLIEVTGAEALWLLDGVRVGRLVFTARGLPVIRPAGHLLEHGTLVVRAAVPADALAVPGGTPAILAYHADEVDPATGRGWSVTALGPAEPVTDPHAAAHYRRVLAGWTHGPHDTLLRIRPQHTSGHRLDSPPALPTPA